MNTMNTTACNRNDKDICSKNNQVHCRYTYAIMLFIAKYVNAQTLSKTVLFHNV